MAIFRYKSYTLREEVSEIGTRCFISFKDGQGEYHELEVSPAFYQEFRRLELNNRKLQNWDQLHREFSEVWDETLNRRATLSWLCIILAAPFAALGFVTYNGMTAEQFLWAWIKSEVLTPKRLVFKAEDSLYRQSKDLIRKKEKEVYKTNENA